MHNKSTSNTWANLESQFKQEWEAQYANTGIHWGEIREAHHFGWDMARRPEFLTSEWDDVQGDLAYHWYRPELTSEETAWEIASIAAHDGWDKSRRALRTELRH